MFVTRHRAFRRYYLLLHKFLYWSFFRFYYKRFFKDYGNNIGWGRFFSPIIPQSIKIACPENISIGQGCKFDEYTQLLATPYSKLKIGNNVMFANGFAHVTASFDSIEIEDDCVFSALVLIINGNHGYQDINTPIKYQSDYSSGPILIKRGTWIGRGACIMGGVTLGKNTVIGANAVVTKSIPDYCVVVGNPAKVIKQYDLRQKKWIKVTDLN